MVPLFFRPTSALTSPHHSKPWENSPAVLSCMGCARTAGACRNSTLRS